MNGVKNEIFNEINEYKHIRQKNILLKNKLDEQNKFVFRNHCLISLIVPIYNTKLTHLKKMIDSVLTQTYKNWELCLSDGKSEDENIRIIIKEYAEEDKRIKYIFLDENKGISENSNYAINISNGKYIGFLDHDDFLTPDALYEIVKFINENPDVDMIYTDHDFYVDSINNFLYPTYKPGWSPINYLQINYIIHFVIIKKEAIINIGLLNSQYDGYQDSDFIFRVSEASLKISNISKILYTWRTHDTTFRETNVNNKTGQIDNKSYNELINNRKKKYLFNIGMAENEIEYFKGINTPSKDFFKITVIIPYYGNINRLINCLNSIIKIINNDLFFSLEIIIINNNFIEHENNKLLLFQKKYPYIKLLKANDEIDYINISQSLNNAVNYATGNYLAFVNPNVVFKYANSMVNLLNASLFPMTAMLGCNVNYKDSNNTTISNGGQEFVDCNLSIKEFYRRQTILKKANITTKMIQYPLDYINVTALTDAFILIKKEIFINVNGFCVDFPLSLYIVDLCIRLQYMGYYNILNNSSSVNYWQQDHPLYNFSIENFNNELDIFTKKYKDLLNKPDTFLNPNIDLY